MRHRAFVGFMAGLFFWMVLYTSWDYCRPDPQTLVLKKEEAIVFPVKLKKPHIPCPILRVSYGLTLHPKILQQIPWESLQNIFLKQAQFVPKKETFPLKDLSPPFKISVFQTTQNLRI